jgi:hypothetical protein
MATPGFFPICSPGKGLDDAAEQAELSFTEPVRKLVVETTFLDRKGWTSRTQGAAIQVRGLLPLAGDPEARPWLQDGRGAAARFSSPQGMAALSGWDPDTWEGKSAPGRSHQARLCAVADARDHVLRFVYDGGVVKTACGRAGQEDFRDGAFAAARFRRPSFVAALELIGADPSEDREVVLGQELRVADTGNHAVRAVDLDGRVTTLAGTGEPGYRNTESDPKTAQFREPRGIAVAGDGMVYVNDAGNCAIRGIRGGRVFTVAGAGPGRPGREDGLGEAARFTELKGLALDPGERVLYAADGHAIRRIDLDEDGTGGLVSTILGQVLQGRGSFEQSPRVQARFTEPGLATLQLRVVTPDGFSFELERAVLVQ